MADFDPPFADQGERRLPTTTEQQLGFPCGPASRELFNYLFWLHQGQIKSIADEAGVGSEQTGDHTVLKRAVLALIEAAIATLDPPEDPDLSAFVTINQARARLPIFPDVLHPDGHLGVFSPSTGTVRVPAGRDFLHRGIFLVTTPEVDLNTDASKTYHLRWNRNDGFTLRDLSSGTYNPGALAETDVAFDSSYDDMLVARVISNSSNVVTVTNLVNKANITLEVVIPGTNRAPYAGEMFQFDVAFNLNWSRRPTTFSLYPVEHRNNSNAPDNDFGVSPLNESTLPDRSLGVDRYRVNQKVYIDYAEVLNMHLSARA